MKTAGKILIGSGVLIAAGAIAYAVSPNVRSLFGGAPAELTPHQKLQVAINKIISNKSFFSSSFFDLCYDYGNEGAQKAIFDLANKDLKVPGETYDNFNYSGLALINDYYKTHWHMQYQITRIMQSDDYGSYRAQLREHYRDANNSYSTAEILKGIFDNAIDDTGLSTSLAGDLNDYWYHPVDAVAPFAGSSDVSWDQPDTIAWYQKYFRGEKGNAVMINEGPGNTGGGASGGGGGSGAGIDINGNQIIDWVQNTWCQVFPDMCANPDPTDCGFGSIYDPATNSCIPDPQYNPNDPGYNPCGDGSHLNDFGQCVPDDLPVDPCNGMGIYNELTGQCEMPSDPCNGMGVWNPDTQQCEMPQ